ncbi:hypothetical protein [Actinoallomurus soli]|uniref:hypothetical protein n=1 Tax=Actinoallomurus soli TaxID=2952535 RepID=UPI002093C1BE|nr:hypothetical protein [Actinoallomurus soli]MCO5970596.1 hypothetical protein [Actinoallomurus soli]
MIDFSGRATRAGTRGIAAAAAVSCFTIMPQLTSHEPAHADGPGGPSARAHDHRAAGRERGARPGGREYELADGDRDPASQHGASSDRNHDAAGRDHRPAGGARDEKGLIPPRPKIIFDTRAPQSAVVPGRTYTWPYSVTNTGSAPVRNVTLTTTPNHDLKIIALPPKCGWHGRDLICRIGVLPGRQTRHGGLTATVDPRTPNGRTLSSPARISWDGRPGSTTREMAFPPVTASQPTDLAVTGDDLPEIVRPGGEVPYEITVTNEGPVTAEAVVVRSSVANDPDAWPSGPGSQPLTTDPGVRSEDPGTRPCAPTADPVRPLAGKSAPLKPTDPLCGSTQDRPASDGQAAAVPPCAAAQAHPASAPRCGAEGRQPACGACAAQQPGAQGATVDRPHVLRPDSEPRPAGQTCGACAVRRPAAEGAAADRPETRTPAADVPAARPACGACAGRPAEQQGVPACGACAGQQTDRQNAPACGACAGRQDVPACGSAPNGPAADLTDRPVAPPCGAPSPARVAGAPGKEAPAESGIHRSGPAEAPIGPGIAPERPGAGADTPIVIGKGRHCLTQGPGFVCPLGAIPPGRTRKLRLTVRARPHARPGRLRCLSTVASGTPDDNPANNSVACHTRNARPMPARPNPGVRRLPHTGFPYGTVALAALGFASVGLLLVWIGRTRRGEEV